MRLRLERLGVVMEGEGGDPLTEWGVLNPGSARAPDGRLFLFPRLVAHGNVSRIGRALVELDDGGRPTVRDRDAVVLAPDETWERHASGGGVEDPRITRVDALAMWVMAYTAYGPLGPRVALATSADLQAWTRLGPVTYAYDPELGIDLNLYPNKDAALFPEPVRGPDGRPAIGMLHRPMWDDPRGPRGGLTPPRTISDPRPGIWLSYVGVSEASGDLAALTHLRHHRLLALPEYGWEELKIGAGTPPMAVPEGWLLMHHGVAGRLVPGLEHQPYVRYSAGALVLDADDPLRVMTRTAEPLLEAEEPEEREGIVPNVVFPTAIEPRGDGTALVFYGMADARIGAARLHGL